jgi:hypothetical protein
VAIPLRRRTRVANARSGVIAAHWRRSDRYHLNGRTAKQLKQPASRTIGIEMRHSARSIGLALLVVGLLEAVAGLGEWTSGPYVHHVPFWIRLPIGLALGTGFLWVYAVAPIRRRIARR